jgi:hypothetical protein
VLQVCLTSPGFAKDVRAISTHTSPAACLRQIFQHVQPTPRPEVPLWNNAHDIGGPSYSDDSPSSSPTQPSLAPPPPVHQAASLSSGNNSDPQSEDTPPSRTKKVNERNPPGPRRKPPSTPLLVSAYRYCGREGFVKPLRAHHCRACGKVWIILKGYQSPPLTLSLSVCAEVRSSLSL